MRTILQWGMSFDPCCVLGVPAGLSCPSIVDVLQYTSSCSSVTTCTKLLCARLLQGTLLHPKLLPWPVPSSTPCSCSSSPAQSHFCKSFSPSTLPALYLPPGQALLLSVTISCSTRCCWALCLVCMGESSGSADTAAVTAAFKPSLFPGSGWWVPGRPRLRQLLLSPGVTGTARALSVCCCLSHDSSGRQPRPYPLFRHLLV